MLTYVFPGQGSQAKGMGASLFDEFPEITRKADSILGYSIKNLCLDNPENKLNNTRYTQPALFTVNALTYLKKQIRKPDFTAGHSLGEYNALWAANVFDFETGLQLVQKRGELMSLAEGGAMAAIIGLERKKIQALLDEKGLNAINIANHNSPTQIVISGPAATMPQAEAIFKPIANYIPLNVSGAFHSPHMANAQQEFAIFLKKFQFSTPTFPVLANVDALPYHPAVIASNLAKQITHSVEWTAIMEYLLSYKEMTIEEIGPGTVLTGILRKFRN